MSRVHLEAPSQGPLAIGACGIAGRVSRDINAVTCRICQRRSSAVGERIGEERLVTGGARSIGEREARVIERSKLGHADDQRARFGSWASLHEFRAAVVDDGSGTRSSSDPSRFGARVSSSRIASAGRDDIISVDLALARACVLPMLVGGEPVQGAELLAVYLARCEGRPFGAHTGPGRKGRVTRRLVMSAEDVAQQWGGGHTAKHVAIVVRGVRDRARPLLAGMGMLEAACAEKETTTMNIPGFDLHGWGEIATHLGLSEASAMRLEGATETPLPVKRTINKRVIAKRQELDAWMLTHALARPVADASGSAA